MPIVWLFWAATAVWIGGEILIFARDVRPAAGTAADRGSRAIIVAAMIVSTGGAGYFAQHFHAAAVPAPRAVTLLAGSLLMLAGIGLRHWAVHVLGRFFRTKVTLLDDHRLVDSGPYARLRNPSYTGAMLTCAGFGLAFDKWLSLALMLVLPALAFANRVRVEEQALAQRFGPAWDAYRARSWAMVPLLW